MESIQDNLKNAGFDKIIQIEDNSAILNHFILKILERQRTEPKLLDELY